MFDVRQRATARLAGVAAMGVLVGILSLGAVPAVAATESPSPTPTSVGAGSISGTVTDTRGVGIADADVSVVPAGGGAATEVTTGSLGGYTVAGLPAGTFSVSVVADGAGPVFWPDATTLGDARTVEVSDTAAVTGIDVVVGAGRAPVPSPTGAAPSPTEAPASANEAAPDVATARAAAEPAAVPGVSATYSVNVRLTGGSGGSLDAYVTLINDSSSSAGFTDASGETLLTDVPPGSYSLDIYPSDVTYAPYWQRLEVTGDTTTDVVLQRPGTVSGHVASTDASAIDVRLLRIEDLEMEKEVRAVGGQFTMDHVRPGQYLLEADADGGSQAPTFSPGVFDPHDAAVVTVGPGATVEGLDFALLAGHSITGTVTGVPLESGHANATSAPIEWQGQSIHLTMRRGDATAGRDGSYTIEGLADGDYLVSVQGFRQFDDDSSGPYLLYRGYYKGSPTASGATPVPVHGENVIGIDIVLLGHGTASGEVGVEGGAAPLENTLVTAYRWNGATWDEVLSVSGWGRYSLGARLTDTSYGLPEGTYTVGFSDPDAVFGDDGVDYPYCPQYWNGEDAFGSADHFEVVDGEDTPGIDATLRLKSSGCVANGVVAGAPMIVGTPQVGGLVTADSGSWAPLPIQLAYQWRANGVDIDGATSRAFTPTAAQAGTKLTVAVTGSRPGFDSVTVVSPESALVLAGAPGTLQPGRPGLSGPALSSVPLVVSPGDWAPPPVDLTYQWSLDGKPIDGATGAGYTPTATDVGGHLTVSVTGTKSGYTPATVIVDAGTVSASIALDSSSALPGGAVVVAGSGYEPGETVRVELHSTVIQLGTAVADAGGNFRLPATLPLTVVPGEHHIFAIGERSGREASVPITVGSPTPIGGGTASSPVSPPALADTGTTVPLALTVLGIMLTVAGAVLLRRPGRRGA